MYLIITLDVKKTVFSQKSVKMIFIHKIYEQFKLNLKILYRLWNMDILHNLSVTGHKLHDNIIVYS